MILQSLWVFLISSLLLIAGTGAWPQTSPTPAPTQNVLLLSLFKNSRDFQIGGTCHAYAAATYLEAECKRRTGESIRVSEAYAIYQHYVNQSGVANPAERTNTHAATNDYHYQMWGKMDAGDSGWDLQRMMEGDVCEYKDFPSTPLLRQILLPLRKAIDYVQKTSKTIVISKIAAQDDEGHIDELFRQYLFDQLGKNVDPASLRSTHSKGLKECLKQIQDPKKFHDEIFSREKALQLIKSGRPFICRSAADLTLEPRKPHIRLLGGKSLGHSSVVAGYFTNPKKPKGPVTWILRDSNYQSFVEASGSCSRMIWID